ncbi:MAG TPA: hypothetical protein VGC41_11650 [Kofleriaceae bacterium]
MRVLLIAALAVSVANAEPLPSGAIGVTSGIVAGTGADNKRVGVGLYEFGAQASWQPTTTERRWGWTVRWAALFGLMYGGSASHIDTTLRTVAMDLTIGVRVRPWASVSRYLTFRGGGSLLRSNEPIPTDESMTGSRSYVGGVAEIGIDQYLSIFMLNLDVRYAMIGGGGPAVLSLMFGGSFAGP